MLQNLLFGRIALQIQHLPFRAAILTGYILVPVSALCLIDLSIPFLPWKRDQQDQSPKTQLCVDKHKGCHVICTF